VRPVPRATWSPDAAARRAVRGGWACSNVDSGYQHDQVIQHSTVVGVRLPSSPTWIREMPNRRLALWFLPAAILRVTLRHSVTRSPLVFCVKRAAGTRPDARSSHVDGDLLHCYVVFPLLPVQAPVHFDLAHKRGHVRWPARATQWLLRPSVTHGARSSVCRTWPAARGCRVVRALRFLARLSELLLHAADGSGLLRRVLLMFNSATPQEYVLLLVTRLCVATGILLRSSCRTR